jgi:hypothetical protein
LLSQLPVNGAVLQRCLFVSAEHANTGLQQETAKNSLVARSLSAHSKSGAQFSQHDEGKPDFIGEFDRFNHGQIASA